MLIQLGAPKKDHHFYRAGKEGFPLRDTKLSELQ